MTKLSVQKMKFKFSNRFDLYRIHKVLYNWKKLFYIGWNSAIYTKALFVKLWLITLQNPQEIPKLFKNKTELNGEIQFSCMRDYPHL